MQQMVNRWGTKLRSGEDNPRSGRLAILPAMAAVAAAICLASAPSLQADDAVTISITTGRGSMSVDGTSLGAYTASTTSFAFQSVTTDGEFSSPVVFPNLLMNPRLSPASWTLSYASSAGFASPPVLLSFYVPDASTHGPVLSSFSEASSLKGTRAGVDPSATLRFTGALSRADGTNLSISGILAPASDPQFSASLAVRNDTQVITGKVGGILVAANLGTGALVLNAGSSLQVGDGTETLILGRVADFHGTLQLGNGGAAGALTAGGVDGGPGGGTVVFDHDGTLDTFTTPLIGALDVIHEGAGTTVLSGTNSYTGGTTIKRGTLSLAAGAALTGGGNVEIGKDGTLAGAGSAGAVFLRNGGTLGDASAQTLSLDTLQWDAGGVLQARVGPGEAPVATAAWLTKGAAGPLSIEVVDTGLTPGTIYPVLTTTNPIIGFSPGDFDVRGVAGGEAIVGANTLAVRVTMPPIYGVAVTTARSRHRLVFTVTNTGNSTTRFQIQRRRNVTNTYDGPPPAVRNPIAPVVLRYELDDHVLESPAAIVSLAPLQSAKFTVIARKGRRIVNTFYIRTHLLASCLADPSKSASASGEIVLKPGR